MMAEMKPYTMVQANSTSGVKVSPRQFFSTCMRLFDNKFKCFSCVP